MLLDYHWNNRAFKFSLMTILTSQIEAFLTRAEAAV